jgi:biopolymer transport protein ExbD
MNTSRLLIASLVLSLAFVDGCQTKPKPFRELVRESPHQVEGMAVKPSPLTLAVHVDVAGAVTLNQEPMGTADNTTQLIERLKQIFDERERNHVYALGSETIAKAVAITASRRAKYVTVTKVTDAIKSAGGGPIGLQIVDK